MSAILTEVDVSGVTIVWCHRGRQLMVSPIFPPKN